MHEWIHKTPIDKWCIHGFLCALNGAFMKNLKKEWNTGKDAATARNKL